MDKLKEWLKANTKDGANIDEALKLADVFDGLTREQAAEMIKGNKALQSAFDFEMTKRIEDHDKRFNETKLPEILKAERAKIEKEMNPDLTPEQKRIKELEDRLNESENRRKTDELRDTLRAEAKKLGFDPIRAERFHVYGENAVQMLKDEAEYYSNAIKTGIESEIKNRFPGTVPVKGDESKKMTLDEIEKIPDRAARLEAMKANGY